MTTHDDEPAVVTDPPDDDFDAQRLRTVARMRRSTDDRMVAGVCAGAADYLRIDPVVLRVIFAALSFVGLVGVFLYAAAWLLIPEDGDEHSIASEHLSGRYTEEQVRTTGLVIAGVAALLMLVAAGTPWGWRWGPAPWVPFWLLIIYLVIVRPHRARRQRRTYVRTDGGPATSPRCDHDGGSLWALTMAAALVAAGIVWALDIGGMDAEPPGHYAAAVLAVIGAGTLVGVWAGNARPLIPTGILVAIVLVIASQMPAYSSGQIDVHPTSAAALETTYELGAGEIRIDLTDLTDVAALDGQTVTIELGAGRTEVLLPDGVDVDVDVTNRVGEVTVFDHVEDGFGNDVSYSETASDIDLRLVIDQRVGQVEVTRP